MPLPLGCTAVWKCEDAIVPWRVHMMLKDTPFFLCCVTLSEPKSHLFSVRDTCGAEGAREHAVAAGLYLGPEVHELSLLLQLLLLTLVYVQLAPRQPGATG